MTTTMQKRGENGVGRPQQTFEEALQQNAERIRQAAGTLMDGGRLMSLALIAVGKTPSLATCTMQSLMQAVLDCARYGLEPDGVQAAIVPRKGVASAMPMYQGLVTIAFDEPTLEALEARTVREGDEFEVQLGSHPRIVHRPLFGTVKGAPAQGIAYYAVAHMRGHATFEVMSVAEVELIRMRSQARGGPWDTDYDEMAKKTVLKRLLKKLPKRSTRLRGVIEHDNTIEAELANDTSDDNGRVPDSIAEGPAVTTRALPPPAPAALTFDAAPAMKLARFVLEAKTDEDIDYAVRHVEGCVDESDAGKAMAAGLNALVDWASAHVAHLLAVQSGDVDGNDDFIWRPAVPTMTARADWMRKQLARFEAKQAENTAATV